MVVVVVSVVIVVITTTNSYLINRFKINVSITEMEEIGTDISAIFWKKCQNVQLQKQLDQSHNIANRGLNKRRIYNKESNKDKKEYINELKLLKRVNIDAYFKAKRKKFKKKKREFGGKSPRYKRSYRKFSQVKFLIIFYYFLKIYHQCARDLRKKRRRRRKDEDEEEEKKKNGGKGGGGIDGGEGDNDGNVANHRCRRRRPTTTTTTATTTALIIKKNIFKYLVNNNYMSYDKNDKIFQNDMYNIFSYIAHFIDCRKCKIYVRYMLSDGIERVGIILGHPIFPTIPLWIFDVIRLLFENNQLYLVYSTDTRNVAKWFGHLTSLVNLNNLLYLMIERGNSDLNATLILLHLGGIFTKNLTDPINRQGMKYPCNVLQKTTFENVKNQLLKVSKEKKLVDNLSSFISATIMCIPRGTGTNAFNLIL